MRCRLLPFLAAALLGGCATAPAPRAPAMAMAPAAAAAVSTAPAHDQLNALLWMQTSTEYRAVMRGIWRDAEAALLDALQDRAWSALPDGERMAGDVALPPAVIVDIDETVLDNSPYLARHVLAGKTGFEAAEWRAWVAERAARALPGAREFAELATAHGVTMIYISNRDQADLDATSENLAAQGLPLVDDSVLLLGAPTPGCVAKGGDKGCRRRLIAKKYRVLQMFGDNLGDFVDGVNVDREARERLLAPHAEWLGRRWFFLPNPSYGSWESALTRFPANPALKNDPRAAKRAALREH